ncbi:hypothetical protein CERSUDRAFT_89723 [Gelatoporia subvermispora B]|uniref:Uncharacterized protein n=1 Tax=Ceriporiopsis subvermispora (strain B) TaxID=914234 RepID=M2QF63_CERS8|nr:hypothetical protein CERSUDRAFT_89723 [Gelatoporia subvermispora B]
MATRLLGACTRRLSAVLGAGALSVNSSGKKFKTAERAGGGVAGAQGHEDANDRAWMDRRGKIERAGMLGQGERWQGERATRGYEQN